MSFLIRLKPKDKKRKLNTALNLSEENESDSFLRVRKEPTTAGNRSSATPL